MYADDSRLIQVSRKCNPGGICECSKDFTGKACDIPIRAAAANDLMYLMYWVFLATRQELLGDKCRGSMDITIKSVHGFALPEVGVVQNKTPNLQTASPDHAYFLLRRNFLAVRTEILHHQLSVGCPLGPASATPPFTTTLTALETLPAL